jgi:hypothetical protein
MRTSTRFLAVLSGIVLSAACLLGATSFAAPAFAESPWWQLSSSARPTNLPPGGTGTIVLTATNLGDKEADGETTPITITDTLPEGLEATAIEGDAGLYAPIDHQEYRDPVTCSTTPRLSCTYSGKLPSYERISVEITVNVAVGAHGENEAQITGGNAPAMSVKRPLNITSTPTSFGVEDYELVPEEAGGGIDAQAGSHPFQLTSTIVFNQLAESPYQPAQPKDQHFDLPGGLVGDPTAFPQCTDVQFGVDDGQFRNGCPAATAIGVAMVTAKAVGNSAGGVFSLFTFAVPVFNLEPTHGEPARFGFDVVNDPVVLDTAVRTGGNYSLVVNVDNTTQTVALLAARVTLWGVPGDPRHNSSRGWECGYSYAETVIEGSPCVGSSLSVKAPFLTLPSSCEAPFETSVTEDSWTAPSASTEGTYSLKSAVGEPVGLDGCSQLPFSAEIEAAPDVQQSSSPSGLKVDVHVPQEASLNPQGLAGSDVRDINVTLPGGVTLNPSGANGLEACSDGDIGYEPPPVSTGEDKYFTATLPSPFCPDASKIGEVKITTPLLANPLKGAVYLASQNENPFGSLVAMYIVAEDPVSGVLVKLPGEVKLNGTTGQIEAVIQNSPQLPFEDAELHFFGGERAPLSTPARCGVYTTTASFTPWSGNAPVSSTSSFEVTSGRNGGPCPGASLPFSPSLTAGTTNVNAGAFSPLTTTITREDGQQNISSIQLRFPAGLSGVLAGVPLCGEAEASAGTCSSASQVGETIVSVGLGGDPYSVTGGKVYITGPYHGAPFGLSIVTPANAGPFHLGNVIVRGKLEVNPHTAALTFTSNSEAEGYAIPQILDGIPLQIKHVNVTIDRGSGDGDFTFNPTNCDATAITGSVGSVEGASAGVQEHFQVTNCASLKFEPKFASSTSAKTSKAKGASLSVKLTYPKTPQGTEANIAKVKVDLPKQLPSRLTTLQKACVAKVFEESPEKCPKESEVGHAKAITPILPVPLEGPAYFVSHGGEAFPSLIVVLKGYGVTVDLVGTTFISKAGITSSTFKTVPDVPVGSFELTLPEGKYSALAANLPASAKGSFCGQTLAMPTAFVAQNGVEIHESTPVSVSGCAKKKTLTRAQKLTAALKACKKKAKDKRATCEVKAHKQYRPTQRAKKK